MFFFLFISISLEEFISFWDCPNLTNEVLNQVKQTRMNVTNDCEIEFIYVVCLYEALFKPCV